MRTTHRASAHVPAADTSSPTKDATPARPERFSDLDLTFGAACPWTPLTAADLKATPDDAPGQSLVDARCGATAADEVPRQQLVREIAGGKLFSIGALNVLHLKGSAREMGYQHGALLKEAIPDGALTYFGEYIEKGTGRELLGPARIVWPLIKKYANFRISRNMPDFARETLEGLAEGAGMPLSEVKKGVVLPDTLVWLFSKVLGLRKAPPVEDVPSLGCTSAIAWGDATKDGKLLHGRNLDYLPVGPWPESASVIFHEPDEGQRYVSVASAGIPLGGVSAMNEAGLTLTVHQHLLTDHAELSGTPIGIVGDIIMREAKSLDEAEAILAANKQIGSWTYMITDGKAKEVLTWEGTPRRQVAHRSGPGDETAQKANFYYDRELRDAERPDIQPRFWNNNEARDARVRALLGPEREEKHDPSSIARILGDTGDDACRIADAVASLTTVASMVFEPESGTLWVSEGAAPTCHGNFIPFSLDTMGYAPERGHFSGQRIGGEDPKALEAFAAFRDSYLAKTDDEDVEASIRLANEARTLQPDQPLYHKLFALLSMTQGRYEDALDGLNRAIDLGHPDEERVAAFHLWRGRVHSLLGDTKAARGDYLECLDRTADPRVHEAARRSWSRPYTDREATKVAIDFRYVDVTRP